MNKIIGKTDLFAIEWKTTSSSTEIPMGHIVFWIEGKRIGNFEDIDYFRGVSKDYNRLQDNRLEMRMSFNKINENQGKSAFKNIWENPDLLRVGIGENSSTSFDDFSISVLIDEDNYIIFWEQVGNNHDYPHIKKEQLNISRLPMDAVDYVLKLFSIAFKSNSL